MQNTNPIKNDDVEKLQNQDKKPENPTSEKQDTKLTTDVAKANPAGQTSSNDDVDEVILKALEKVKEYFFHSKVEEHKLAEFMFKILTLNVKDTNPINTQDSPETLDQIVDKLVTKTEGKSEPDVFNNVVDNLLGPDAAKAITDKLYNQKIDDLVEKLLGEDTRKLICQKLESQNLDELLNKLIEEKFKLDEDPHAEHPNFDDFIQKILGKETEEFIKKKLEVYLIGNPGKSGSSIPEDSKR